MSARKKLGIACRHCGEYKHIHSRGLCEACFTDPYILAQYPQARKGDMPSDEFDTAEREEPDEPTDAQPGSEKKIREMMKRLTMGKKLFHDDDRKIEKMPEEDE